MLVTRRVVGTVIGRAVRETLERTELTVLTRSDGTRDRKATIYFAPEVDDTLEAYCTTTGRQREHLVAEDVREYLARRSRDA